MFDYNFNNRQRRFGYSDFWMPTFFKKRNDIGKLLSIQQSVSNFVRILTGKNIRVHYLEKGNSPYTDGRKIYIGNDINNLDKTVGEALHEASHIVYTDTHTQERFYNRSYSAPVFLEILRKQNSKDDDEVKTIKDRINLLRNWIEDRRIDNIIFNNAPGYRGYYEALYNDYFYDEEIDKALQSKQGRTVDWESHSFRIINLINRHTDLNALPKLRLIYNTLDLKNISRLKSNEDSLNLAIKIYDIIVDELVKNKTNDIYQSQSNNSNKEYNKSNQSTDTDSQQDSNQDDSQQDNQSQPADASGKTLSSTIKHLFKKQLKIVKNDFDKKQIDDLKDIKILDALADQKVKIKHITSLSNKISKYHIIVIDKPNEKLFNSIGIRHDLPITLEFYSKGISLGKKLGNKLQVRKIDKSTIFNRLDKGTIDRRRLSDLGFKSENVFYKKDIDIYNPVIIHISVDASGSMNGVKWHQTQVALIALATASLMVPNLDIVINYRYTLSGSIYVATAFDSRINTQLTIKNILSKMYSMGMTPEGLCFEAIQDKLMVNDSDTYFINFSDGQPSSGEYHDETALEHTRKEINKMRTKGIKILSFYIANTDGYLNAFKHMYGKDAVRIDVNNVIQLAKKINNLFIIKD